MTKTTTMSTKTNDGNGNFTKTDINIAITDLLQIY